MGDLLHLHSAHDKAQLLLPWYANGTLEPEDIALVEAHLGECDECRADVAANRALRELYAETPVAGEPARAAPAPAAASSSWQLGRRLSSSWGKAAQLALAAAAAVTLFVVIVPRDSGSDGDYRLLGSDEVKVQGNAIVLFSPDTAERDLRAALEQVGARLVDGPTASGAYVVQVPEQRRAQALASLRGLPHVVLAEPVDVARGP